MGFLRLVLALAVVVTHCGGFFGIHMFPPATVAVQAFFIISGFYMSLVLFGNGKSKYSSNKVFYTNRLLRLYPTFFILLVLKLILSACDLASGTPTLESLELRSYVDHVSKLNFWTLSTLIFSNLTMLGQDLLYLTSINIETGALFLTKKFSSHPYRTDYFLFLPQAWSLSIEIMFYAIAPFILKRKWYLFIPIVAASFSLRYYMYSKGYNSDPWNYRFFPLELALFLMGSLSHRMYAGISWEKIPKMILYLLAPIPIIMTFFYHFLPPVAVQYFFNWPQMIYYCTLFFLIPVLFQVTKKLNFDRDIGELSFPIYLIHLMLIPLFTLNTFLTLKVMIASTIFSAFIVKYVDKPIDRLRQKRAK